MAYDGLKWQQNGNEMAKYLANSFPIGITRVIIPYVEILEFCKIKLSKICGTFRSADPF